MKKLVITGAATLGLALGAFAQGSINVDNSALNPYITINDAVTHYAGPTSVQIWELNGTTIPSAFAGVNGSLAGGNGAYSLLAANGFKLEATLLNKTTTDGILTVGQVNLADVSPAGSSVVLAMAVLNQGTWNWAGAAKGGLTVFVNPTSDYTILPPNTPTPKDLTGWDAQGQNLVMQPVPEPSTFALAGLGAAALLIFRRRK